MTTEIIRTPQGRLLSALASLGTAAILIAGCASSGAETAVDDTASTVAPTTAPTEVPTAAATEVPTEAPTAEATEVPTAEATPEPTAEPTESDEGNAADSAESDGAVLEGVLTDVVADAQGGRAFFDGTVDEMADLDDLVADAWGDGGLGLHRGHAQIENVLEAFLGIDHGGMHDYMDQGLNLAATAEAVGQNPEALVITLTNSYAPFVTAGVDNGVISAEEAETWIELIRTEFNDRVYWDGVSDS